MCRQAMLVVLMGASFAGCNTVSDQAPKEFHDAQAAVDKAQAADVDDSMPRAMEAAERKLEHSLDLLDEAGSYESRSMNEQAEATRKSAIAEAVEARQIAEASTKLVSDVDHYDSDMGAFFAQQGTSADASRLAGENAALKTQNADLLAKVDALTRSNADFANRPIESEIPADFRVAKPVAFFGSGKTTLNTAARNEIEELARLLKQNDKLAVTLEGFADPRGSAELNMRLAERRVKAVADEIIRMGVPAERVVQTPIGATGDRVAGQSPGSLQLDRKVVAKVTAVAH